MQYDEATYDRIEGTLLGAAVGDALGAPYEFTIPGPTAPEMIGGGIGPWEPGEWTDDTQLTICIARAAVEAELEPIAVGERFAAWFAGNPKDVGHQTGLVLAAADNPAVMTEHAAELYARRPRASAGNGSLMRTAPVALAHLGDDAALATTARAVSDLTHGDPLCGDACVLWCVAIDRAIREQRLDGIDDGIALLPHRYRRKWIEWIEQARREPMHTFVPNGYVVTALQAALAAITATEATANDPIRHGLNAAISIGHDTDTVGAIAGALLGARWGRSSIPSKWLSPLHGWPDLDADGLGVLARRVIASAG